MEDLATQTPDPATPDAPEPQPPPGGKWFVVQTLSNKEGAAKRYIDRYLAENELENHVYEVLVPMQTVSEVKAGKKTQRQRKLYPGYIFIRCRLYGPDDKVVQKVWYYINGADGVIGFAGGKEPAPLKDAEIQTILDQVQEAEGKEVPKVQFEVGEQVKITDGPFENLSGGIDEIDPERGKLKVSVSIFGRFTPVELEYWQVERLTEED